MNGSKHPRHGPHKVGAPVLVFLPTTKPGYTYQLNATCLAPEHKGTILVRFHNDGLHPGVEAYVDAKDVKAWTYWD